MSSAQQVEFFDVVLLTPAAVPPERKSAAAAGYDLCSAADAVIEPGCQACVPTGLVMRPPSGTYIRIAARSGLAARGVHVGAGVVDADYRGEVKVILFNTGKEALVVGCGDRIAQAVLERIETPPVRVLWSLDDTDRGAGGFGSTGV